jgi:hypothetical protein
MVRVIAIAPEPVASFRVLDVGGSETHTPADVPVQQRRKARSSSPLRVRGRLAELGTPSGLPAALALFLALLTAVFGGAPASVL